MMRGNGWLSPLRAASYEGQSPVSGVKTSTNGLGAKAMGPYVMGSCL